MPSNLYWFFLIFFLPEKSCQWPASKTLECECGTYEDFAVRIVGGRETAKDRHPWLVAIVSNELDFCGGTLINDRYILTAAHCLKFTNKENLQVFLGIHSITELEALSSLEIDSIITHENFTTEQTRDKEDIGLIKLKNPVMFNPSIKPVCLPKKGEKYSGVKAKVLGWGLLSENSDRATVVMETDLTTLSQEQCMSHSVIGKKIGAGSLCAYADNSDACQGDSGGPLIHETRTGKMEQIGIVSWGIGCARQGIPGVYTRITHFLEWIKEHTKDARYCATPE